MNGTCSRGKAKEGGRILRLIADLMAGCHRSAPPPTAMFGFLLKSGKYNDGEAPDSRLQLIVKLLIVEFLVLLHNGSDWEAKTQKIDWNRSEFRVRFPVKFGFHFSPSEDLNSRYRLIIFGVYFRTCFALFSSPKLIRGEWNLLCSWFSRVRFLEKENFLDKKLFEVYAMSYYWLDYHFLAYLIEGGHSEVNYWEIIQHSVDWTREK